MIPGSGLGILMILAGLLPGYAFLRAEERRAPRPERSPLVETAELIGVGLFSTALAAAVVSLLGLLPGHLFVDLAGLASKGRAYGRDAPYQSAASGGLTLILSLMFASKVLPAVVHRKVPATLQPGMSAWHQILGTNQKTPKFVDVELNDGRIFAGIAKAYSFDLALDQREIVLASPVYVQGDATSPRIRIHGEFIILRGDNIRSIGVISIRDTPHDG